mgnify:FL=1
MAGKKIGDDRKYFWFQVRFRGLITLGVWKSAKNIQNYSNSLRSDSEQFLNNADSHAPRVTTPTANAPETKNISCLLAGCGTAGLLLLTSFTVMRLATTGYADEIFSQKILQDDNA